MEKQHPIGDLMTTTMQKLREIADVNTIVGKPILAGEITIIPISKLTVGFASGGSDFTSKNQKPEDDNSFGGGSGAGMNLSPVAFLYASSSMVTRNAGVMKTPHIWRSTKSAIRSPTLFPAFCRSRYCLIKFLL